MTKPGPSRSASQRPDQPLPQQHPWMPAPYAVADAKALQMLAAGEANPDQQKRALKWIIEVACATYDMSYRPASSRDTDFAEGKRHVGAQIVKLLKINISRLKETS